MWSQSIKIIQILLLTLAVCESSSAQIEKSVGTGGVNDRADVEQIQRLLNSVSDLSGGPEEPLDADGRIGPRTIAAINRFQKMQLGFQDGRIDPRQATELRLLRLNGIHEVLGVADTNDEKLLAEFTTAFSNIVVIVDGKSVSVRPSYHINAGDRKAKAEKNRQDNPAVGKLIKETLGVGGASIGKASPEDIHRFLQAAIDAELIAPLTPDGLRDFLAKYGVSTDCSGLASRGCNLLSPDSPLDVVGKANTAYLATLNSVASPADLTAGNFMVKGGSHVRLITDVDVTPGGIEFTTLESAASSVLPNGNGIGEKRWRFPQVNSFENLQKSSGGKFVEADADDAEYIYTSK